MSIITQETSTAQFLADILGNCGGCFTLFLIDRKRNNKNKTQWFDTSSINEAAKAAEDLSKRKGVEVFYSICPSRSKKESGRIKEEDVYSVSCLWADIDIAGDGHKNKKNYAPNKAAWKGTFKILPPSYIIDSGHGLHVYWLLSETFKIKKQADAANIKNYVKDLQKWLSTSSGFDIDSTEDLSRILRVPNTVNYKDMENPLPVKILFANPKQRYKLQDIQKKISQIKGRTGSSLTVEDVIRKCRSGKSAALFERLYKGDTSGYPSPSEAGQAFVNIILPRCDGDQDLAVKVFQSSGLWDHVREKHKGRAEEWILRSCRSTEKTTTTTPNETNEDPIVWIDTRTNKRGDLVPILCSDRNVEAVLNRHNIKCRYDELKKEIVISGFDDMPYSAIETKLRVLCQKAGLAISKNDIADALSCLADRHRYNPVADWLREAKANWDGKSHIDELYNRLHLTEGQNKALCAALFKKWLIGTARIAFNTGTNGSSGVLILCGKQGCGKTRFVQSLSPYPTWVQDGLSLDPNNKDDVLKATRFWICELGEIGQTMKRERRDRLKAFFTSPSDAIRKPYGRVTEEIPRRTSFIGTINDERDEGFLTDSTGSRRFWPIRVEKIDPPPKDFDLAQLWGEVMHIAENESEYLTDEELHTLSESNLQYDKISAEERIILDSLDWESPPDTWRKINATGLAEELNIRNEKVNRVGRALVHIAKMNKNVQLPKSNRDKRYLLPQLIKGEDEIPIGEDEIQPFKIYNGGRR